MADAPLDVLILWHMHQPCYERPGSRDMAMPWARLHGLKDYLDMLLVAEEFPGIHLNFNWVPSLLDQIEAYAAGEADDEEWRLSRAVPEEMDETRRVALLKSHFAAHPRRLIEPFPRYAELWRRRGNPGSDAEWRQAAGRFEPRDLRDLQVWMNLTWTDPLLRARDPFLEGLVEKGADFTEEDKAGLFERHRAILGEIIPATAKAWAEGRIEVSASPYYHPILPLLYDTDFARRARPDIVLPRHRFRRPEDAEAQIEAGVARVEALLGRRPVGMWPSEGSVCDEIIPLLAKAGIRWIASDEEVLAHSLGQRGFARDKFGNINDPHRLYRAYGRQFGGAETALVFRDHSASDLIGFQFSDWPAEAAAEALIARLEEAQRRLAKSPGRHAVSLILDGENCWEYYEEDGIPFLRAFYDRLQASPRLRSVTIAQHLEEAAPIEMLPKLHSGSWINHDFRVWIGHREDNVAWDLLYEAREAFEQRLGVVPPPSPGAVEEARKSLWIAEGSDWNWWYGDEHSSANDPLFDALYRSRLRHIYTTLGAPPPQRLDQPIHRPRDEAAVTMPRAFLSPTIEGRPTSYFEWYDAGVCNPAGSVGAMRQSGPSLIHRFYFGFDATKLYLRLDLTEKRRWTDTPDLRAAFVIFAAQTWRIDVAAGNGRYEAVLRREEAGSGWSDEGAVEEAAADIVLEAAVPFKQLGLKPHDAFSLQAEMSPGGDLWERQPPQSAVALTVPDADYEARMWMV